jgi:hypothetical protein
MFSLKPYDSGNSHWFKVTVVYLFSLLAAANTLTIITQLIHAGNATCGQLSQMHKTYVKILLSASPYVILK